MKWREETKEKAERFVHFLKKPTKKVLIGFIVIAFIIVGVIFIRNKNAKDQISKPVKVSEKTEITLQQATVDLAKESVRQDTVVTIKAVSSPKLEAENLKYASKTYEITSSQAKFEKPVVITLSYDPSQVDLSHEGNIYIATWEGNQWKPLEGNVVDRSNHTISAAVDHFSIFTVIFDALGEAKKKITEYTADLVLYRDLPSQIKNDLAKSGFSEAEMRLIKRIEIPTGIKLASLTIVAANDISKVTGVLIGGTQSKEALAKAAAEAIGKEIAKAQGKEGQLLVKIYKLGKGAVIAEQLASNGYTLMAGIGAAVKLPLIYASAVSWILGAEMDYINANLDEAYSNIWQFNFAEGERLTIYQIIVATQAKTETGGLFEQRGIKFYYYDSKQNKFIKYYYKLAGSTIEFQSKGEETKEGATEFPPIYGGAEKVGKEFESPAADDKPLESCQAYGVKEADPSKIESWYKDKLLPLGWQLIYGDQLLEFRKQTDESFMVQVVGDYDWKTLPLFKEIPDKRELAEGEVGFLLCWSKQKAARETPTILPTMKVIPSVTPKVESKKITTVSEFEKLPDTGCYEKQIIPLVMQLKITQDLGNTLPGYGYNGQDETGTVSIGTLTEEKLLEVGKTYQLKGCKSNIGGGQGPGMPYFHLYTDQKDAIVEK